MGRLYCHCLNVVVHHAKSIEAGRLLPATALLPEHCKDPVAGQTLLELELDVAGVVTQQKGLMQVRVIGDWRIHHCSNCRSDVFVTHTIKSERILISSTLVNDSSSLQSHKNYSPVFKLVLNTPEGGGDDEVGEVRRQRVSSMTYGREDPTIKLVHHEMKRTISQEQAAVEERIKKYEEEQRSAFIKLQKRALRDRSLLFAAITRARESGMNDAMAEPAKQQAPSSGSGGGGDVVASLSSSNSTSSNKSSPADGSGMHRVTITLQDRPSAHQDGMNIPSRQEGDEGLFNFDEDLDLEPAAEAIDYAPFPQSSDDDETSTDDGSFRDMSTIRNIAASLPIGVPMFPKGSFTEQSVAKPTNKRQMDPSDVARSIQQLALSVQDTGMFGDLPKPRISSRK